MQPKQAVWNYYVSLTPQEHEMFLFACNALAEDGSYYDVENDELFDQSSCLTYRFDYETQQFEVVEYPVGEEDAPESEAYAESGEVGR